MNISIIDKDKSGVRVIMKIKGMQTAAHGSKLNHPPLGIDFEDTATTLAIIRDVELLPQLIKQKDICNAVGIEIYWCVTKVSIEFSIQRLLIAMHPNGPCCGANVINMIGLREEVDRGLAIGYQAGEDPY